MDLYLIKCRSRGLARCSRRWYVFTNAISISHHLVIWLMLCFSAARSCPQLLAAAQTLCDFAVQSGNHNNNPNGILRWPTMLSQKSMKARKSKLIETPLERHGTTESSSSLHLISSSKKNNHVRKDSAALHNHHDRHHLPKPSKRLKLSTMENKKVSFPSSSASAIESDRKHSSSSKFKNHSRMMMPPPPPPTRTLQKSSTYPHKARRFPGIGW